MRKEFINIQNVFFKYNPDKQDINVLTDVNLNIRKGEFISIIGKNGAGKSTLARLLNGILIPTKGSIYVNGINTNDYDMRWEVRKSVGIVFQNPDNQLIGTTVKEEVAFGPENLGINPDEIQKIIVDNLDIVGFNEYINHHSFFLSGGQKQKLAIASVLAMSPECIIFDEAASMIDSFERKEIMKIIKKINKETNTTIINITHSTDEILESDRVIVLDKGKVLFDDTPKEVFSNVEQLIEIGVPPILRLFYELSLEGIEIPIDIENVDSTLEFICKKVRQK